MLAFVHKLPCRDDDGVTTKDLSKVRAQYLTTKGLRTNDFWLVSYIFKHKGCQWEAPYMNVYHVHDTHKHTLNALSDNAPRQEMISVRQQDVILITNAEELTGLIPGFCLFLFLHDVSCFQPHTLCVPLSSSISNSTQVCEREV